jgi:hypothetical protein
MPFLELISKKNQTTFIFIMAFYALLSFFVGPLVGLKYKGGKDGITHGIIIGCIISLALWNFYGAALLDLK